VPENTKTSPFAVPAAHKVEDAQDNEVIASPEIRVVPEDQEPELSVNTLPPESPTAQKVADGHETWEKVSPESRDVALDHEPRVVEAAH
jgi:hypothetical protein